MVAQLRYGIKFHRMMQFCNADFNLLCANDRKDNQRGDFHIDLRCQLGSVLNLGAVGTD
jgi:hypothetical protein